jgi:hypothetical protein
MSAILVPQTRHTDPPRSTVWIATLAPALVALIAGATFAWNSVGFCLDDAWIHLAYARSLSLGDGLSYNPGDHATGFSSPLWVLVLALWPTGATPVASVKALGIILHIGSAALATRITLLLSARAQGELTRKGVGAAIVAGLLTAASPLLLQAATSGMEVTLTTTLLLGLSDASLRGRQRTAGVVAALATLARPESLFFAWVLSAGEWFGRRRARELWPAAGATLALLAWMAYCYAVSGYPWPNTKYAKNVGVGLDPMGLIYIAVQVLPREPWLVGLGGLLLFVLALWRTPATARVDVLTLAGGWLVTLLAIAVSRPCSLLVLFYDARYFAIVLPIAHVVVALGTLQLRTLLALAALLPVAIVNVDLATDAYARTRAQEQSIEKLHVMPARYLANELPSDAVVVVEGAGATRFFTPRSMTLVDLIGLNACDLVHARDKREFFCRLWARRPTHVMVPDEYLEVVTPFDVTKLRVFTDPAYSLSEEPFEHHVFLFAIRGVKERFRQLCARSPDSE